MSSLHPFSMTMRFTVMHQVLVILCSCNINKIALHNGAVIFLFFVITKSQQTVRSKHCTSTRIVSHFHVGFVGYEKMLQYKKYFEKKKSYCYSSFFLYVRILCSDSTRIQVGHQCWSCFDFPSQSQLLKSAKEKKTIKCKQSDDNVINPFQMFFPVQFLFWFGEKFFWMLLHWLNS